MDEVVICLFLRVFKQKLNNYVAVMLKEKLIYHVQVGLVEL